MTTRDLFAAHAMRLIGESVIHASEPSDMAKTSNEDLAAWAYDLADAMMDERHRRDKKRREADSACDAMLAEMDERDERQKRKHPDGETTD